MYIFSGPNRPTRTSLLFTLLNGMGCMARPLSRGRGLKGVEHPAHFIKACPVPRHTLPHPSMHASSELMHVCLFCSSVVLLFIALCPALFCAAASNHRLACTCSVLLERCVAALFALFAPSCFVRAARSAALAACFSVTKAPTSRHVRAALGDDGQPRLLHEMHPGNTY